MRRKLPLLFPLLQRDAAGILGQDGRARGGRQTSVGLQRQARHPPPLRLRRRLPLILLLENFCIDFGKVFQHSPFRILTKGRHSDGHTLFTLARAFALESMSTTAWRLCPYVNTLFLIASRIHPETHNVRTWGVFGSPSYGFKKNMIRKKTTVQTTKWDFEIHNSVPDITLLGMLLKTRQNLDYKKLC